VAGFNTILYDLFIIRQGLTFRATMYNIIRWPRLILHRSRGLSFNTALSEARAGIGTVIWLLWRQSTLRLITRAIIAPGLLTSLSAVTQWN